MVDDVFFNFYSDCRRPEDSRSADTLDESLQTVLDDIEAKVAGIVCLPWLIVVLCRLLVPCMIVQTG